MSTVGLCEYFSMIYIETFSVCAKEEVIVHEVFPNIPYIEKTGIYNVQSRCDSLELF